MHQQLSLHGSVQDGEIKITLHTLAALAGMHPSSVFDHCLVWTPRNPFTPVLAAGQVNQIEQYRITSTSSLIKGKETLPIELYGDGNAEALATRDWEVGLSEIPEAGKRKVTSRSMFSSKVVEGNMLDFLNNLGYTFSYEYFIRGYRFVMGDVVVTLFRTFIPREKEDEDMKEVDATGAATEEESKDSGEKIQLLDPSGQWTVRAEINVKQLVDVDAIANATSQLERIQFDLMGLFELSMPDRASFDTRVKAR